MSPESGFMNQTGIINEYILLSEKDKPVAFKVIEQHMETIALWLLDMHAASSAFPLSSSINSHPQSPHLSPQEVRFKDKSTILSNS